MVITALLARTSHVAVRPVSSWVRVNSICTESVSWKVQKYAYTTEIAVFRPHEPWRNFIKQSPSWKTNIHPASHDIPSLLWNLTRAQFIGNGSFNQKLITTLQPLKHGDCRLDNLHSIRRREFDFFSVRVSAAYPIFSPTVNGSPYRVVKAARVSN